MKIPAIAKLRNKLAAGQAVYGLWITLESASLSEIAVALGLDWIVIDAEHGHLDWKEILEHVRATVRSDTVALVRIAESNAGLIKRVLDIGADGVVVPWIEMAAQLHQAVRFSLYPPEGVRGIGAERATGWGQCLAEHTREANAHVLVVPLIETVTAGRNIQELCGCREADIFFLGPADYSSTAGFRGQWEGPGIAAELLKLKDTLRANGKFCGVLTTSHEDLVERRQDGFRLLGLGADTGLLFRSLHAALGIVGQDRRILATLVPEAVPLPPTPLARPPESLRPDRPEMMNKPGTAAPVEVAPGVLFDCHVGGHNEARGLTTGLVTFEPSARNAYHTHPCPESITVLSGSVVITVEGREYALGALDNIVIPKDLAHGGWNASATLRSTVHVAFGSSTPARILVAAPLESWAMPTESVGVPGKERVTRIHAASHYVAGPGTRFVDYCNRDLVPGIELSGGYGLFDPGGRLPAHAHYFDESICIVQGEATCVVEGRRHQIQSLSTALQPRGRVHYFVNTSTEPMAMIWIYAGAMPDRVLVDEYCTTIEGDPWKRKAAGS